MAAAFSIPSVPIWQDKGHNFTFLVLFKQAEKCHLFIYDGCWWQRTLKCWEHSLVIGQMLQKLIVHHRRNFQSNLTFLKYRENVPSQGQNMAVSSSSLWPAQGWLTHSITLMCPRRDSGDHPAWTVITASPHLQHETNSSCHDTTHMYAHALHAQMVSTHINRPLEDPLWIHYLSCSNGGCFWIAAGQSLKTGCKPFIIFYIGTAAPFTN